MRIAVFLVPAVLFGASEAKKIPIIITDLLKIRRVTEVEVAHDGSFAVYGVQEIHTDAPAAGARPDPNAEPSYSYRTHLFYIDLNDALAKPVQLSDGDRNDAGIALSPDGTRLAFTRIDTAPSRPGANGGPRTQVWIMPVRGLGEAQVITHLENGAAAPRWRPDGKALLVTSLIPISKIEGKPNSDLERPKREWFDWDKPKPGEKPAKIEATPDGDRRAIRNWLERNAAKENPSEITRLNFLAEMGLAPEITIAHLFAIDLEHANQSTQLTKGFYASAAALYSPDGSQIVFTSSPQGSANPDRMRRTAIWMMNADGSHLRMLLEKDGRGYSSARFTSDGETLVAVVLQADQPRLRLAQLARYDVDTKRQTWLADNWESSINNFQLATDGSVLFASNRHGGEPLERAPVAGGAATALTQGPTGVSAFGEGGGKVVYALISVADPNELFVIDKNGPDKKEVARQLTDLNASWLAL